MWRVFCVDRLIVHGLGGVLDRADGLKLPGPAVSFIKEITQCIKVCSRKLYTCFRAKKVDPCVCMP